MKLPDILKEIGEIADQKGINAFVVGGFVRDALLGIDDKDIDIVVDPAPKSQKKLLGCGVEANAIDFAKILAEKFIVGAGRDLPLHVQHDGFKTATIEINGYRIDFATARKERYKKPAVLPEIVPATVKEDLLRRDFTINAMAVSLNKDNFTELIDFYGGSKDLKDKKIRVLHDKSFIDDPTRIFRAIKFQERLGFEIEPHTKKLMIDAIDLGMIEKLKPQRVKKEMELILKEQNAFKIISKMHEYGLRQIL